MKSGMTHNAYEVFSWRLDGSLSFPRQLWPILPSAGRENFGDALSHDVVRASADSDQLIVEGVPFLRRRFLFSIGSVLQFASPGDFVWGTGHHFDIPHKPRNYPPRGLRITALRGHYTAQVLEERLGDLSVSVFGDPGLLAPVTGLPTFDNPSKFQVLPNHSHANQFRGIEGFLDPTLPWSYVATQIKNTRHLITSSLHGVILADVLGVPRTIFSFPGSSGMKFADYESAISIDLRSRIHDTFKRAALGSPSTADPQRIEELKTGLRTAFPSDIKIISPLSGRNSTAIKYRETLSNKVIRAIAKIL